MYTVAYIEDGSIKHKNFNDKEKALQWVRDKKGIKALKLLKFNHLIDCCDTVQTFNEYKSGDASAMSFFKKVVV